MVEDVVGDWLDIGSGGGFLGIVIVVLCFDLSVFLLESDKCKCSFFCSVVCEFGLENVKIINEWIE